MTDLADQNADRPIDVVGAVIVRDGAVLCARRGATGRNAGLWEFPGGKVEPGESPADALVREIGEELGCRVSVGERVVTTTHRYDFATVRLTTFRCALIEGEPTAGEHAELRWVRPAELGGREWAPADIPTVARLAADGA